MCFLSLFLYCVLVCSEKHLRFLVFFKKILFCSFFVILLNFILESVFRLSLLLHFAFVFFPLSFVFFSRKTWTQRANQAHWWRTHVIVGPNWGQTSPLLGHPMFSMPWQFFSRFSTFESYFSVFFDVRIFFFMFLIALFFTVLFVKFLIFYVLSCSCFVFCSLLVFFLSSGRIPEKPCQKYCPVRCWLLSLPPLPVVALATYGGGFPCFLCGYWWWQPLFSLVCGSCRREEGDRTPPPKSKKRRHK